MKNIFTVTLLSLFIILLATACTPAPRSPADEVIKPDGAILQQQKDFDEAMIQKQNISKETR